MIKNPTNVQTTLVLQHRAQKVLKYVVLQHRAQKVLKNIGFTTSGPTSIKKALVLQYRVQKVVKKHWFYRPGNQNVKKTLVLQTGQSNTFKKHWFYFKTKPRATGQRATAHQSEEWNRDTRSWRYNEEPLQPSCLGKKSITQTIITNKIR